MILTMNIPKHFLILAIVPIVLSSCDSDDGDVDMNNADRVEVDIDADRSVADERRETLDDLQRMRDRLTRELDAVRARLNDGSLTADERERNTSRAATLAQGLERLDRTYVDLNTSPEDNWINLRTEARSSRDDWETWLRENDVKE